MSNSLLNPIKFVNFLTASADAKDGYIMCAIGQDPKKLNDWYFDQYKENSKQYKKALEWKKNAAHVYDCQGLADCFVGINVRARNNFAEWCTVKGSGAIPNKYKVRGAAVFTHNGSYISHVGYLEKPVAAGNWDGDWWVVEARGVMYGVVRTKLSDRNWNRWGLMDKKFDYVPAFAERNGGVIVEDNVDDYGLLGSRLLKRGCKGEDVRMLQQLLMQLGYKLPKYGDDGDFGEETEKAVKDFQTAMGIEVDGMYGEESHEALMAELDDDEDIKDEETAIEPIPQKTVRIFKIGSWRIRKGPGTTYNTYSYTKQGAEFPYVSVADNGWLQISVNGTTGWVSPTCAEIA